MNASNLSESGPVFRAFQIGDYDQAYALWSRTEGVGVTPSDSRRDLAAFLDRNPDLSLTVLLNDRLVGTLLCGHDGRRGSLYHLVVARDSRRHGLGRAMVDRCLANLARAGIPKCRIFFFTSNVSGEAFWRHQGWTTRAELGWAEKPTPIACGGIASGLSDSQC